MTWNPLSNGSESENESADSKSSDSQGSSAPDPEIINGKEWLIEAYDPGEDESDVFAGAWPRAMIENAKAEPKQPLWLGVSERTGREVPVEFDRLFRHVFYGGATGAGKTTKMYNDAVQLMYGDHGICIIDPKGDDVYGLLRRVPEDRWDDVIYIAPGDDYLDRTVGFNLFETYHEPGEPGFDEEIEGIVEDFKELIAAGEYWGPRMDRIMKTMVRGMIRHPREFTPIEMYYTLLEEENRAEYADLIGDEIDDDDIMFLEGFTRRIAEELGDSELDPLIGRLKDWVENPMTRQIIAQRESNVSIAAAVNEGKIVIVKNNLPDEPKKMVATAIMRRVWTCISDRIPESERKIRERAGMDDPGSGFDPYFMMIDECHTVLTDASKVETILSEARSKRLGLMLATQYLHRLDDDTQQAILQNCNTMLAMNTNLPQEASVLAKRFGGADEDDITTIPDYQARTKLRSEDDAFLAKLTPPYPPLHSIDEAYDLIQRSLDQYGVKRRSGREILDEMFFTDTQQSAGAEAVGQENTEADVDEPMDVDDTETARAAVKAIYDATIRAGEGVSRIPTSDAHDYVEAATGLGPTPAANMIERLESVGAIEQRSTETGLEVSVTPDGRETIGLQTGSGGSGGSNEHRYLLRQVYEWGTKIGYDMDLPTQDGDELPDAVGEMPPGVLPAEGLDDLTDDERKQLLQSRLEGEYDEILEFSGTNTLYIEVESKGLTKPGGPIKNAVKAPGPEQLLFVVGDGGSDGLTTNAERLAKIFGVGDEEPYVSSRSPSGATRKFYTRNRITMNPATVDQEPDRFAAVADDVSTEWVELPGGEIVCRERGGGETIMQFEDVEAFRNRELSDAPATVHYDIDREGYAVEIDGELKRVYGGKGPLTDDWSWIYEPLIPESIFAEHGHDDVPDPEAFQIAIVPNDDRGVDEDLLLFDVRTGDVESVDEANKLRQQDGVATPEDDRDETTPNPVTNERAEPGALAEARAVAGEQEHPTPEDPEGASDDRGSSEMSGGESDDDDDGGYSIIKR